MKRIYFLFAMLLLSVAVFSQTTTQHKPLFTIVLDAGHGGLDSGAIGKTSKEKDINLAVTLLVGKMIEENHPDTRVIFTRKNDMFVPLHMRANIANDVQANLFVSIHTNAAKGRPSVLGTETYVLGADKTEQNLDVAMRENSAILHEDDHQSKYLFDPNSVDSYIMLDFMQNLYMNQSINFAKMLQTQLKKQADRKDRGVRQAGFLVLLNATMPSALVELGYISNETEERYLNSSVGRQRLAEAIYQAFVDFKDDYVRKTHGGYDVFYADADTIAVAADSLMAQNIAAAADSVIITNNLTQVAAPKDTVFSAPAIDLPLVDIRTGVSVDAPVADTIFDKALYKIQLCALSKRQPTDSPHFKGLENISYYEENGLFKYTCGASNNLSEIQALQKTIKPLFPQTILVAFYKGKKIALSEAARITKAQEQALSERATRILKLKARARIQPQKMKPQTRPAPEIIAVVTEQTEIIPAEPTTSAMAVVTDMAVPVVFASNVMDNNAKTTDTPRLSHGLASPRNRSAMLNNTQESRTSSPLSVNREKPTSTRTKQSAKRQIVYQLQLLQSNAKFEQNDKVFKGLAPIKRSEPENMGPYKIYKYTYGESNNLRDMLTLKQKVVPFFGNASVVAFDKQNGKYLSKYEMARILKAEEKNLNI